MALIPLRRVQFGQKLPALRFVNKDGKCSQRRPVQEANIEAKWCLRDLQRPISAEDVPAAWTFGLALDTETQTVKIAMVPGGRKTVQFVEVMSHLLVMIERWDGREVELKIKPAKEESGAQAKKGSVDARKR